VFAVGVLILKRRWHSTGFTENVRCIKLNELDSQHPVMISKSTNSWDYEKLKKKKEDSEDDDNLAVGDSDKDDDQKKNSD